MVMRLKTKLLKKLLTILSIFFIMTSTFKANYGEKSPKNILGGDLQKCKEGTGFYRNGFCNTGADDHGTHVVCAIVTTEFLEFTKSKGNDLSTPTSYFPGLKNGDHWCLCGYRFEQARKAGKTPKIILEATHSRAVDFTPLEELKKFKL